MVILLIAQNIDAPHEELCMLSCSSLQQVDVVGVALHFACQTPSLKCCLHVAVVATIISKEMKICIHDDMQIAVDRSQKSCVA